MSEYNSDMVWELYQKGVEHHRRSGIYVKTEKNYDFFDGNQWEGLKTDGYTPPVYNIIRQIVNHKYSNVVMQNIEIVFSSEYEEVNSALNFYGREALEEMQFDKLKWDIAKNGAIAGDSYLYVTDRASKAQTIDNIDIYLSDETSSDIQSQKYIIISERRFVSDVRTEAAQNGCEQSEIELINSDSENESYQRRINEVEPDSKCTSLLFMYKEGGTVKFLKAVQNCIYQPAQDSRSRLYPIAGYVVNRKRHSARGYGNVEPLIPNQIEINKTLFRRAQAIKNVAFPKLAYNADMVRDVSKLNTSGAQIGIRGSGVSKITDFIGYLNPGYVGNDAKELTDELIVNTKELNSSGDGALGQVNPESSSGAAIQAVTQQANIALTEQLNAFVTFVEDLGRILLEFWKINNPEGLVVDKGEGDTMLIEPEQIDNIKFKINVSSNQPMDKMGTENELKQLFVAGAITFDEFVESLDDDGYLPKAKFEKICSQRQMAEENQKDITINNLQQLLSQYQAEEAMKGEAQNV